VRVVALLATYNEERFVGACLDHLAAQGVDAYLIDNGSTDKTVELAQRRLGRGLIGIESLPRSGVYSWRPILQRKAELASTLAGDWFIHVDADEFRLPPNPRSTLAGALEEVDSRGYNAVNFQEFTFVPTREEPDHDHQQFQKTMRRYYPFSPPPLPRQLNAWKGQPEVVDFATSGGHEVRFPGLRMYPETFPMRHYLFLSVGHAIEKYVRRLYDPVEVSDGWHVARARLEADQISLLPEAELRRYVADDALDASGAWTMHPLFAGAAALPTT
jgi:glycosyltransferase involved in cell wall biosynthesis